MQTMIVHLRHPFDLGWRGLAALMLTLGAAVASAALQGPVLAWIIGQPARPRAERVVAGRHRRESGPAAARLVHRGLDGQDRRAPHLSRVSRSWTPSRRRSTGA
jgi:hypothetical protein